MTIGFPTGQAFVPTARHSRIIPSHFAVATSRTPVVRHMSNLNEDEAKVQKDGSLYDDEVAPRKEPISDQMRARLAREASSGLDPDSKQTNVLLYIMLAITALVILGGKDILF